MVSNDRNERKRKWRENTYEMEQWRGERVWCEMVQGRKREKTWRRRRIGWLRLLAVRHSGSGALYSVDLVIHSPWHHFLWRHFPWRHFPWRYFLWRHFLWCHFPWRHFLWWYFLWTLFPIPSPSHSSSQRTPRPLRDGDANYRFVYPWVRIGTIYLLTE